MAQQGQGFDMSKVSTADKIILGGAGAFIIWTFIPVWWTCCSALGLTVAKAGMSGFHNTVVISWILAVIAIVEIVIVRMMGTAIQMPLRRGQLHLGIAVVALLFTLLGLVAKPNFTSLSWGIFVGIVINLVWAYGAYMLYSEPASAMPPNAPGAM